MTETTLHPVEFRDLPLDLWHQSHRWMEDLLREFTVIASSDSDAGVPRALLALVDDTRARFSHLNPGHPGELEAAHAAGRTHVDLRLRLPKEAGEASLELWEQIVRSDRFCREGDLLITPPTEPMWRFLHWYLHEVRRQLDGAEATPWSDSDS